MLTLQTPGEFFDLVGQALGTSEWRTIEQQQIDGFASLTGDDNWIHVDTQRARHEMPGGNTIAHGFYTASLIPILQREIFRIEKRGKGINYGIDRVRFTAPVAVGSRIRLHQWVKSAQKTGAGIRVTLTCEIEVEGMERRAVIGDFISLIHEA